MENAHADRSGDSCKLLCRDTPRVTWHKGYVPKGHLNYSAKIARALLNLSSLKRSKTKHDFLFYHPNPEREEENSS